MVLAYVLGSNACDWFVVMKTRGRTRADEVAWLSSVYSASTLLFFAAVEMRMCEAYFESALDNCSIAES